MTQLHTIPPVYDEYSRVLVLGSFPSVRSREAEFFYAHPQNRFWRVLAALFSCPVPQDTAEKKSLLLDHGVALWDVIAECEISGSSDSSIRGAAANDISPILAAADIRAVFLNGQTAYRLYKKHIDCGLPAFALPSTSPANAARTLDALIESWRILPGYLGQHSHGSRLRI